ncbi:unnamed protein product, partial [Ectocarpus sp. 12 AP-2014]
TPRDAGGGHESEKRRRREADGHGDQDAGGRHGRGGGWLFGTVDAHDNISRDLAEATRMIVVSVGYRLAPEVKFPGPVKDGVSAIRWAKKNIWAFGGDPHRIAIVGESSGANLAITSGVSRNSFRPVRGGGGVRPRKLRARHELRAPRAGIVGGGERGGRWGVAELQAILHWVRARRGAGKRVLGVVPPEREGWTAPPGVARQGKEVVVERSPAGAADASRARGAVGRDPGDGEEHCGRRA